MSDENATQAAEEAIDRVASEKANDKAIEIQIEADARVARAEQSAKEEALEARLAALENSNGGSSFDPNSLAETLSGAITSALAPITQRLDALEAPATPDPEPEPAETDPFASQIDFGAMAKTTEKMPKIGHSIFKRIGSR